MNWGVLNAAMLVGIVGAAVPLLIHLLNRRRGEVIDWGAMQFLELGRRARRRIRLTELLLMLARMGLLALVALALARPFWSRPASADITGSPRIGQNQPSRDVVLVLDGSESMERQTGGTTAFSAAVEWARGFVRQCRPGDSIAILVAADRVRPVIDPPVFDHTKVEAVLTSLAKPHGSSDLPAALAESFRILERTENPTRDVIVLTDGQRHAWRPGEPARWGLVRALYGRLSVRPRLWSIDFTGGQSADTPNGSVGPLAVSRARVTPRMPIDVSTTVENAGPGPLLRTAELCVDGLAVAGMAQTVGPIPPGGRAPLSFRTSLSEPGSHLVSVRLMGGDLLPGDDVSGFPIEVDAAFPILLVNGEPGIEPFSGETDFLKAALAPTGDQSPQFLVRVVSPRELSPEALEEERAVVLANVDRLAPEQMAAIGGFLEAGGGLLFAPGDRTDPGLYHGAGWMPARIEGEKGSLAERKPVAHPSPRTFTGAFMSLFAQGDSPALAEADFFAYRLLEPAPGATTLARLDTGDPWVIHGRTGRGSVVVISTAIDAEAGTLPVNPDFVPLAHEWLSYLAGGGGSPVVLPGERLIFKISPRLAGDRTELAIETPGGTVTRAQVEKGQIMSQVRFEDTSESGIYRLVLPEPPGGFLYAAVMRDGRESDLAQLDAAEARQLSEGWPLTFEQDPDRLIASLFASGPDGKHEIWRFLIIAALAGLCLEIYLTRRLVRGQGLTVG
jgi:hypothetical protein